MRAFQHNCIDHGFSYGIGSKLHCFKRRSLHLGHEGDHVAFGFSEKQIRSLYFHAFVSMLIKLL